MPELRIKMVRGVALLADEPPWNRVGYYRKPLQMSDDAFSDAFTHFMRCMSQCGNAHAAQFAQVAVVETDYGKILRHMNVCIGQFFDQPICHFVVIADNGGAAE